MFQIFGIMVVVKRRGQRTQEVSRLFSNDVTSRYTSIQHCKMTHAFFVFKSSLINTLVLLQTETGSDVATGFLQSGEKLHLVYSYMAVWCLFYSRKQKQSNYIVECALLLLCMCSNILY